MKIKNNAEKVNKIYDTLKPLFNYVEKQNEYTTFFTELETDYKVGDKVLLLVVIMITLFIQIKTIKIM